MSLVADYSDSDDNGEGVDANSDCEAVTFVSNKASEEVDGSVHTEAITPGETTANNFLMAGESSNVDSSDSESDHNEEVYRSRKSKLLKLDNPFRTVGDINVAKTQMSVFRNPFRDKEVERIAVLEKHVKMTENTGTALTINGKKICWNYRKRKCYLGSQCPFAHDSDVPLTEEQLKEQKAENDHHRAGLKNSNTIVGGLGPTSTPNSHLPGTASTVAGGYDSSAFFTSPHLGGNSYKSDVAHVDDDDSASTSSRKRTRVGLRNGLIPPKKALNLYNKTKDKNVK